MAVFALVSLAFLQCFLFKSLRLQCKSLWKRPPQVGVRHLRKTVGAILILCFVLCMIAALLSFQMSPLEKMSPLGKSGGLNRDIGLFAMCTVILSLPLAAYHLFVKGCPEIDCDQITSANNFAIRCGSWSLLGFFLILGGLVLEGLAHKELNSAPSYLATPFAYSVIALIPVCPSGTFLFLFAVFGGFFVALMLPHRGILARQRILASAQGGAVGSAVVFSLLIVVALSLAICTVWCLPSANPPQNIDTHSLQLLLANGQWPLLGLLYVVMAFCFAACVASIWTIEAMFACVIIWIKGLFSPVTASRANPEFPAKNPPPAPNA